MAGALEEVLAKETRDQRVAATPIKSQVRFAGQNAAICDIVLPHGVQNLSAAIALRKRRFVLPREPGEKKQ